VGEPLAVGEACASTRGGSSDLHVLELVTISMDPDGIGVVAIAANIIIVAVPGATVTIKAQSVLHTLLEVGNVLLDATPAYLATTVKVKSTVVVAGASESASRASVISAIGSPCVHAAEAWILEQILLGTGTGLWNDRHWAATSQLDVVDVEAVGGTGPEDEVSGGTGGDERVDEILPSG